MGRVFWLCYHGSETMLDRVELSDILQKLQTFNCHAIPLVMAEYRRLNLSLQPWWPHVPLVTFKDARQCREDHRGRRVRSRDPQLKVMPSVQIGRASCRDRVCQ